MASGLVLVVRVNVGLVVDSELSACCLSVRGNDLLVWPCYCATGARVHAPRVLRPFARFRGNSHNPFVFSDNMRFIGLLSSHLIRLYNANSRPQSPLAVFPCGLVMQTGRDCHTTLVSTISKSGDSRSWPIQFTVCPPCAPLLTWEPEAAILILDYKRLQDMYS